MGRGGAADPLAREAAEQYWSVKEMMVGLDSFDELEVLTRFLGSSIWKELF